MKRLPAVLAGAGALLLLAFNSAWAVETQPGGPNGAVVTVGDPTTNDDDETIERCQCDGGPLEAITVHTDRGDDVVRIDQLVGRVARTNDGQRVGQVIKATNVNFNPGIGGIVLVVAVDDGLMGDVQRIAVRRTAFYYQDGVIIIETNMDDLRQSVSAGAAGAGAVGNGCCNWQIPGRPCGRSVSSRPWPCPWFSRLPRRWRRRSARWRRRAYRPASIAAMWR